MKSTILNDQKAAVWRQHIERANQYPEGIQKYCNANGLSIQTYYKWKLKLNSKNKSKRSNFPCCQGMGLIPIMMSAKLSNSSKVVALGISVNKYLMAS